MSADDPCAPAAHGMRLELPAFLQDAQGPVLLAPLRGWRRALGALVVDGPLTADLEEDQRADFARELSRQMSAAIENIQLLDEVLRQRRLLEDTFNSLLDLVVVTDDELRIVQMNEAFVERTALSRAELMDRALESLVGPELAAWAATADAPDAASPIGGRTRRFEDPRLGGTLLGHDDAAHQRRRAIPAGHVIVARDITHEIRLEQEQAALRERLAQSEKLAALGQFVAGIAHEMNNPLQGVLGHLELLMETSTDARPLRRDLRRIYHEADRAAKIVRNLLVFAGSRRMMRRRMRVSRVLSRAISSRAASLSRAAIEVTRDEAADLPAVLGDPLLMHQAFLNILINAEHAILGTGQPGRIEVTAIYDAARPSSRDQREGLRPRHRHRGAATHLRPVLHDQGRRAGHGAGAGDHLRDHPGARRDDRRGQRAGRRGGLHHQPAGGRVSLTCQVDWLVIEYAKDAMEEGFLTTEEVLEYLQVNLRTVYRLIKAGKIPAVRVGRQWRFRKRDIDAWLESQRPRNIRPAPAARAARARHRAPARAGRGRRGEHPGFAGKNAGPGRI